MNKEKYGDILKAFPFGATTYADGNGGTILSADGTGEVVATFNSEAVADSVSELVNELVYGWEPTELTNIPGSQIGVYIPSEGLSDGAIVNCEYVRIKATTKEVEFNFNDEDEK